MTDRSDPERDHLWDEFHRSVNMTSEELRAFLMASASGEDALPVDAEQAMPELGRGVLTVLAKRKVDLTPDDLDTMRRVVELVGSLKAGASAAEDDERRRVLMEVGHDPLKPSRTED
ncbi:DUF3140 domain-containing protein [Planomonospora sp. ID91781]|uniref:DNA-binding protein n=1 Tax=Planomonospora sphaerica TaxID=161355 RepID=A0A171DQP6_9ACTN|nr:MULTISPECIES: DUF3140 domain-containing protein [Planomonospora]MBG0825023.1 DUF3140 domain-containing protein [Planomonospora sp. ID91781]GAT71388.1 DNA-binding protein [Planomonospora sphaerica]